MSLEWNRDETLIHFGVVGPYQLSEVSFRHPTAAINVSELLEQRKNYWLLRRNDRFCRRRSQTDSGGTNAFYFVPPDKVLGAGIEPGERERGAADTYIQYTDRQRDTDKQRQTMREANHRLCMCKRERERERERETESWPELNGDWRNEAFINREADRPTIDVHARKQNIST